jgi:hypothetical protein
MHAKENTASRRTTIARLNDDARLGLDRRAHIVFTRNCIETFRRTQETHLALIQARLLAAFRLCEFTADSPEHDFASIFFRERKVWMKIHLYDGRFVKRSQCSPSFRRHLISCDRDKLRECFSVPKTYRRRLFPDRSKAHVCAAKYASSSTVKLDQSVNVIVQGAARFQEPMAMLFSTQRKQVSAG